MMTNILIIWTVVNTICIVALVVKVVVLERKIKDCNDTIINNRKVIRIIVYLSKNYQKFLKNILMILNELLLY